MLTPPIYLFWRRYNILGASIVAKAKSDKTAAKGLFELIGLEPEKYRLGHTKASPTHVLIAGCCSELAILSHVATSHIAICCSDFVLFLYCFIIERQSPIPCVEFTSKA